MPPLYLLKSFLEQDDSSRRAGSHAEVSKPHSQLWTRSSIVKHHRVWSPTKIKLFLMIFSWSCSFWGAPDSLLLYMCSGLLVVVFGWLYAVLRIKLGSATHKATAITVVLFLWLHGIVLNLMEELTPGKEHCFLFVYIFVLFHTQSVHICIYPVYIDMLEYSYNYIV